MKRISIFAAVWCTILPFTAFSQWTHVGQRTWHAFRGGLSLGMNYTLYTGEIPLLPSPEIQTFGEGESLNFQAFAFVEKPFSRSIAAGLKVGWDPMSATVEGNMLEPYRIADGDGNLYPVRRDHTTDYILRYFTAGGYVKIYPGGGPGFFLGAGFSVSFLTEKRYVNNATITEPEWARGAKAQPQTGGLSNTNPMRGSLDIMIGYEFFYMYGFLSPQLHYNYGFDHPIDASYADSWGVHNIRLSVAFALPLYGL
ncbi:MAG: outer membrane beta-barrel protein [Bacteroidota bacterium]|nr:outer membrane beta-barrel protein [Bacteroidota bacterium]